MKRSADDSHAGPALTRRSTRASVRREQREQLALVAQHERASVLMSTPLLQALPFVLSSGYLYQHDCMSAAATCQNWFHTWKEVEDQFPEDSQFEVFVENITKSVRRSVISEWPAWVEEQSLQSTLSSPQFVRQVVDKVHALKLASKPGKTARARAKAKEALPVWGVDLQVAIVQVWGPNSHNFGGMHIEMGKKRCCRILQSGRAFLRGRAPFTCRLHPDMELWTGIRNWEVYDGEPLWP